MIGFDSEGHVRWTPLEIFDLAANNRAYLINDLLISGTPAAFNTREAYAGFLGVVGDRTGVHPRNLFLRGSCQVGFSIAPLPKVWTEMHDRSDLDLAIVDADYFARINREVRRWAEDNRAESFQEDEFHFRYVEWLQDCRRYNCCRADDLPLSVCVHHHRSMETVADLQHCGIRRHLNAFVYRDWWSVFRRYEWDLIDLVGKVRRPKGLTRPGNEPLPSEGARPSARAGPPDLPTAGPAPPAGPV